MKPKPTYEVQNPTTAEAIAKYLWEVAYPGGATPSEALTFFSDDVVYEDFNYKQPFVGLGPVSEYIGLLDVLPDFVFIPERISQVPCVPYARCPFLLAQPATLTRYHV